MKLDLRGRTALVSGSTAGIGYAAAEALAGMGARTIVNGRTAARVDEALRCIREREPDGDALGAPFDLASADGCAALVAAHPQVDVLVNNLGIFEAVPFAEIDDAAWFRFFETNVMSGVRLARPISRRCASAGGDGSSSSPASRR